MHVVLWALLSIIISTLITIVFIFGNELIEHGRDNIAMSRNIEYDYPDCRPGIDSLSRGPHVKYHVNEGYQDEVDSKKPNDVIKVSSTNSIPRQGVGSHLI